MTVSILRSIARKKVTRGTNDLLAALNLPHDEADILSITLGRNELTVTAIQGVNVDWEGNKTPVTMNYKYSYTGR